MILRSVMKHVLDQNWIAVGIDFVIVVVGVYIGIEVSNWNQSRQERAAEQVILSRLETDFLQILAHEEDSIAVIGGAVAAGRTLRQRIARAKTPEDIIAFCEEMEPLRAFRSAPPPSSTYSQLVANGEMSLIRSTAIRDMLVEFENTRQNHEVRHQSAFDTSLALSRIFWRAVRICDLAKRGGQPKFLNAARTIIETPEFAGDFNGLVIQQENSAQAHANTFAQARRVLDSLKEERR